MPRKKNITIDYTVLKGVEEALSQRFLLSQRALSSELKDFHQELYTLSKNKAMTQSRATKISVSLSVYYSINEFAMEKDIETLILLFAEETDNNIAKVFTRSAQEVLTLLHTYPRRTYMDAELYFIDKKASKELDKIEKRLKESFEKESDNRFYGINRILKHLNSNEIAYNYSVFYTPRFKHVSLQESVEKYQPGHYGAWKNSLIKEHHEYINTHKPDDLTIQRMQHTLEAKLKAAKEEDEYMQKNSDEIEIRIIGYAHADLKPVIKIRNEKHTIDKHLRSEVPNVLWFEPSPFRSDMEADEFIQEAQNPYGDVYYRNKKKKS